MCSAFVTGDAKFAGIFLVQKFDSAFYSLSVGIISLAAINYAAYTFFCVYGSITFIDECRKEAWIAGAAVAMGWTWVEKPTVRRARSVSTSQLVPGYLSKSA